MTPGDGFDLDQTLIVAPDVAFAAIAAAVEATGLARTETADRAPLIAGEPEFATWSRDGKKPFVIYTLNPVAMLRVLDVATAPPRLRAALASGLPLLSREDVAALIEAADTRTALRGLWAARETQRIDLLPRIQQLARSASGLVAEQAAAVAADLAAMASAQETAMIGLRGIALSAEPVIAQMRDPDYCRGLRPDRDACAALFDAELAGPIAEAAEALFASAPAATPPVGSPEAMAATAGLLRWPNALSQAFPRGYRVIAGWMTPQRVWLTWLARSATGGATRYDGLAWLGDRWVWLPKPFRIVAPLLGER
jgi:hypothetical protein